jgi:dolichyl-phosphate-mannose-protein mannosyltransferase
MFRRCASRVEHLRRARKACPNLAVGRAFERRCPEFSGHWFAAMPARQADPLVRETTTCEPQFVRGMSQAFARRLSAAAVAALVVLYWLLATSALSGTCNTCDEIIHLAGGCSYWLNNDYRLQPENGNLPQRWHALPMVLSRTCRLPGPEHPAWKRSDAWQIGQAMFFESESSPELLLSQGRAMAGLLGAGVCLTVFLWSRRLFGLRGAFVSLALAVFCPALLAHGALMTSDACLTLFLLLSVWAIWELLHQITPLRLAGGMIAIAGLFLSKMSAPLIFPMAALMVVVRICSRQPLVIRLGRQRWVLTLRRQQLAAALVVTAVCGLFADASVWAAYGFRYSVFAEGPITDAKLYKLENIETACSVIPGRSGRIIAWMAQKQALPEAYLYGTAYVLAHMKRVAFLNGEYSITGWRHYFPYCFAVKTPLALFGILLLSGYALVRRRAMVTRADNGQEVSALPWYHLAPLAVLLVVFWTSAVHSTFNIGYRHILPVYPALYVVCGAAAQWLAAPKRSVRLAVFGMLGLFAADSLAAWPHYLAYFNPLVPRAQAYQHLVDSNLDWGQDLPGLATWLTEHNSPDGKGPVYLAYFGNGRPAHYGIEAISLPRSEGAAELSLKAGLYCVSATSLQAVYERAGGHWNKAYEDRYQNGRQLFDHCSRGERPPGEIGREMTAAELTRARLTYDYAKYLRLLAYLRHRPPDANVGYSILIFRLTDDEIDQALNRAPAELDDQPWLPSGLKYLAP